MADYGKKTQSDNRHLANLTSARFAHIDGSSTSVPVVPSTSGCRLLRVVLNTNGATITLRSGSRVIGVIATDAPEQTFNYGVYCDSGLTVECSGAVDATVVFGV